MSVEDRIPVEETEEWRAKARDANDRLLPKTDDEDPEVTYARIKEGIRPGSGVPLTYELALAMSKAIRSMGLGAARYSETSKG